MEPLVWIILLSEAALAGFFLWREGLLERPSAIVLAALLLIGAFALRAAALDYETLDYQNFLARWAAFYRENGGFRALDRPVGNYNIPYLYFLALFSYSSVRDLYLIKLLSFFFDVLQAWAVLRLVGRFTDGPRRRFAAFFAALLWPTVVLNSAVWGQCDSMYVSLALLGIAEALDGRPRLGVVLMALSFGFKLQAVFLLPVCALLWMNGKLRLRDLLLFPLSYVLLVLPAVLAGRPFLDTITLYFNQTGSIGSGLNYNSPSIFSIFTRVRDKELAATLGIVAAAVFLLNVLILAWGNRRKLNDRALLGAALLLAIGIPFLLPHMHERYFYAADLLSLILAFSLPQFSLCALLCEFASLLGYHAYLKMRYLLLMNNGAAALIVAMALALICFLSGLRAAETGAAKKVKKRT